MTKPITLHLSVKQADYLYTEIVGLVNDYTLRKIIEVEDEAAIRQVIFDIEQGLKLAEAQLLHDLERLRKINPKSD
jgi:hypothetical protein